MEFDVLGRLGRCALVALGRGSGKVDSMSTIIQTTVYQFDELNDKAKDKAREWFRELLSSDDLDFVVADVIAVGAMLGITFDQWASKNDNKPRIYWSGFWSQGDGACFEGSYSYNKGASKKVREWAPNDTALHKIADELQQVQRRNRYQVTARTTHHGHYYHAGCMDVDTDCSSNDDDSAVARLLRAFADWIYRRLEEEWNWQNADETVDENIRANEYTFTEDGRRFG